MASFKRRRSDSLVVAESCVIPEGVRRTCASKATENIQELSRRQASRGRHASAGVVDNSSLLQAVKSRPHILEKGQQILHSYIDANTTLATQKAMALNIFAVCMKEGNGIIEACAEAAKYTGFNAEVVRRWAETIFRDFFLITANIDNISDEVLESELSSSRGKHPKWISLINDENFQLQATEYVRQHGYVKGAPNLTLADFIRWVAEDWGVDICHETARCWLHQMGFTYRQFSKGIYFDGHEREDVVKDREKYVATMASVEDQLLTPSPAAPGAVTPIIRVFHDESTFYSNADQSFHWSDGTNQALKQKSLGQAIMVSDFIDEVSGYLRFRGEEARLYLEHQTDGYFTNQLFLQQVGKTVDIFEEKYPGVTGMFIFDNAPSHFKKADDVLNPDKMNVSDGGKQPFARDTVWNGQIQKMTTQDGSQKGMRSVLEERGVDTHGMKAEQMRQELRKFEDFSCDGVPLVEEMLIGRGHMCVFIPKFHCELNPIERCWCHAKKYTRAHCNGSIIRLRKIVPEGLDSVSADLIHRFFCTCKDYERAYRDGHTCNTVDAKVKEYKSHRKVRLTTADLPT